jgi:outer membrane protein assembly factor BamB
MEPLREDDPRQVGEFRLRARLGAGGMGRVYLGLSPAGRAVAVKIVHPGLARDDEFLARFRSEVAAAQAVNGIYTAQVVAAGLYDNPPWLATAYIPGPTLQQLVDERGPLPEAALWGLAAGLAEALQAVHAAGLIHRDLKPANVLIAEDGPRVIDFGVSRALDGTSVTKTGLTFGTPPFMSPEQARGLPVGPASDVFSLGSVLCFAATGQPPFGDGNAPAVLYRIVHEQPAIDGLPSALRDLLAACLAKEASSRPSLGQLISWLAARTDGWGGSFWPAAVLSAIRGYRDADSPDRHAPSDLGPDTFSPTGPPVTGLPVPAQQAPAAGAPSRRRALALLGGLGGVAAAGIAVGGWQLDRGPAAKAPAAASSTRRATLAVQPDSVKSRPPGTPLWHERLQPPLLGIAMTDGGVYVAQWNGDMYGLSATTGRQLWQLTGTTGHADGEPQPLVVSQGSTVFWTGAAGRIVAVRAGNGSRQWTYKPATASALQRLATGPGVLVYGDGMYLYALNARTGRVELAVAGVQPTALAYGGGVIYAGTAWGHVRAFKVGKGQLWSTADPLDLNVTSLAVGGGVLLGYGELATAASNGSLTFAVDAVSGKKLWQDEKMASITAAGISSSVAAYGGVLDDASNGTIVLRDPRTGDLRVRLEHPSLENGGMIVVGSTVLTVIGATAQAGGSQEVLAIDGNTGRQLWRQSVDDTVTGIATDGAVICAIGARGGIYAFQL